MGAKCSVCNTTGSNMQTCTKCNQLWCKTCAMKGKGHYPKQTASNRCPYCGQTGGVKPAR